jgi:hypothetical protein
MRNVFFYPASLSTVDLDLVVAGLFAKRLDQIDFPNEAGGTATHAFAVAYQAGMDTIEVTDATFAFAAASRPTEITKFTVTAVGNGAQLKLGAPARLSSVVLTCASPPVLDGTTTLLTVRPMDGSTAGPPLFAAPAITLGGGMYSSTSRPLTVVALGDGSGYHVTFPSPPLGTGWLFELMHGNSDPTQLAPVGPALTVTSVTIDAAPTDLRVTLSTPAKEIPVWNHPGPLYPENGVQTIGFAPIARQQLQAQLASATGPTMPLTLTFTSSSAGTLTVLPEQSALSTLYVSKPLATDPQTVRLGGSWVPLALAAPAQRPASARGVVRVKPRGQDVNAMTPVADADFGSAGAVVDTARRIAVSTAVAPSANAPAGAAIVLAAVRLPLTSDGDSEVVVELHADAGGLPGSLAGAPVVVQLAAKTSATTAFALKSPVKVITGGAPLWVVARCTKGTVRWHTAVPQPANGAAVRASDDGGKTWRALDPGGVAGAAIPFAQLLQTAAAAGSPALRVRVPGAGGAHALGVGAQGAVQLPSAVLDALAAAAPGAGGKATTTIELASDAVADVTFSGLAFVYTP